MLIGCSHLLSATGHGAIPITVGGVSTTGHAVAGDGLHGLQVSLLCGQGPSSLEDGLSQVRTDARGKLSKFLSI